eukprot:8706335-Pyramimonas_sp.AAC.1
MRHSSDMVGLIDRIGDGVHYLVGSMSTLLLGVDRSTAEAILACAKKLDPGSSKRESAPRKTRLCESDAAAYNDRSERGLMSERP